MSNKLDKIQIPKPCPADWEEMTGNDRMRYCDDCKKHVYNLSKMSRREAEALIATRRGNLCARIVRRPDGTILTQEINSTINPGIRRASPVASAVVTAILTIRSSAVAQQPARMGKLAPTVTKESGDTKSNDGPQTDGGVALISGAVMDSTGAVIAGATVRLTNKQTNNELTMKTTEDGEYNFTQVDAGSYSLKVEAPGFSSAQVETIAVQRGEKRHRNVTMNPAAFSGDVVVTVAHPLRSLYSMSELIVIARVGNSVQVETEGESRLMKTRLEISSTLKGARRERAINIYHLVYGGQDETYVSGESLLLFLNRSKEEASKKDKDGYEVFDAQYGIKKLPEADLQVYMQRIDELATIMSKGKPAPVEIVEWLVRCAEDPATRWEGAYELAQSAYSLPESESEDSEESAEDMEAVVEDEETPIEEAESEAVEGAAEPESQEEQSSETALAALLTAAQKERVTQALFNIRTITDKDYEMIELVRHWDDGRLAPFLLSQLRQMEADPPYEAQEIIRFLTVLLDDEAVSEASGHFRDNISYLDKRAGQEAEDIASLKTFNDAVRQNRSEMLRKFIAVAESKIKK